MTGRICTRDVATALGDESIRLAAQRMADRNVGALVVVDQDDRPIGLLTDRDIALQVVAHAQDPFKMSVADVMTPAPRVVTEDAPVETALAHMRSGGFRRLPVVDNAGCLVGLLSLDDVLRLLSEEFFRIGGLLERELPRDRPPARRRTESLTT